MGDPKRGFNPDEVEGRTGDVEKKNNSEVEHREKQLREGLKKAGGLVYELGTKLNIKTEVLEEQLYDAERIILTYPAVIVAVLDAGLKFVEWLRTMDRESLIKRTNEISSEELDVLLQQLEHDLTGCQKFLDNNYELFRS